MAEEEGRIAEIGSALRELAQALDGLEAKTLAPGALSADKRKALVVALHDALSAEPTLLRFLGVVAEADRFDHVGLICNCYRSLEDEAAGRVRASICCASVLDEQDLEAIRDKFGRIAGLEIVPVLSIDEDLIGGVTVELEGRVYDGSVRTRLARLAASMAGES